MAYVRKIRPGEHRMVTKDVEAGTGVCNLCGPVDLITRKGYWRCENTQYKGDELKIRQELKKQLRDGKACEICGGEGQVLDHKHGEKTWRGVLCYKHNTGLGMFDDDPDLLMAAAKYLQKHE